MTVARTPCSTLRGYNFSFVPQYCSFKQLVVGAGAAATAEFAIRLTTAKHSTSFDSEFFGAIVATAG